MDAAVAVAGVATAVVLLVRTAMASILMVLHLLCTVIPQFTEDTVAEGKVLSLELAEANGAQYTPLMIHWLYILFPTLQSWPWPWRSVLRSLLIEGEIPWIAPTWDGIISSLAFDT